DFAAREVLLWSLIMVVAGAILAAYDRIVVGGVLPQPGARGESNIVDIDRQRTVSSATAPVVGNGGAPAAVRLSRREQEVLRLVAEGYSNSMIATRLHLSENTVKTYVENLLGRLNARNRAEAVAAASRQNLI
ncbi:MAG TPA: response regulator transcription factor, partial [Candidatus Dormibacteraeota bacterium]|nr:response regulator transcription factor [Candidatus Dormibacteraeota bacterium]